MSGSVSTIDSVVFSCFATHSLTRSRSLSLSLSLSLALRFSLSLASVFFLRNTAMQIYRGNRNARLLILFVSVSFFSSPHIDIAYPACLDCLPHFRSSIILRSCLSKRRTPNKKEKSSRGRISPRTGRNRATFHEKDAHTRSTYNFLTITNTSFIIS